MRAAQGGSAEALEALFKLHWPAAFRAAYYIVHDAAAAEDIAQEAFLAAVRALDRFDGRRPFAPWINRIVVNRAIDFTRVRGRCAARSARSWPSRAEAPAPEPRHLGRAAAGAGRARRPSSAPWWCCATCSTGRPVRSPGRSGIPRGTVNSRLRRALDRLADAVEEER